MMLAASRLQYLQRDSSVKQLRLFDSDSERLSPRQDCKLR